jgi:hypothetical protein
MTSAIEAGFDFTVPPGITLKSFGKAIPVGNN